LSAKTLIGKAADNKKTTDTGGERRREKRREGSKWRHIFLGPRFKKGVGINGGNGKKGF